MYRILWHLQVAHGLFEHALFKSITNAKFPLWNEIFSIHPMPEYMVNSNTVNVSLLSLITCKIISQLFIWTLDSNILISGVKISIGDGFKKVGSAIKNFQENMGVYWTSCCLFTFDR